MSSRWGLIAIAATVTLVSVVRFPQSVAAADPGQAFKPVAPAQEVARTLSEYTTALEKLAAKEPTRRRGWSKIAHRAWIIGEMANLLTLQNDSSGQLAKQAASAVDAAKALGKTAKLRKFEPMAGYVKTIRDANRAIAKATAQGAPKPGSKNGFATVAPLHDIMEMNQYNFDVLLDHADKKPTDDAAYRDITHAAWLLAESGNLMTLRDTDKKDWQGWAGEMRGLGSKLAAAAAKKDFPAIKKLIAGLDTNCLACHDEYQ